MSEDWFGDRNEQTDQTLNSLPFGIGTEDLNDDPSVKDFYNSAREDVKFPEDDKTEEALSGATENTSAVLKLNYDMNFLDEVEEAADRKLEDVEGIEDFREEMRREGAKAGAAIYNMGEKLMAEGVDHLVGWYTEDDNRMPVQSGDEYSRDELELPSHICTPYEAITHLSYIEGSDAFHEGMREMRHHLNSIEETPDLEKE